MELAGDALHFNGIKLGPAAIAPGLASAQLLYRAQDVGISAVDGRPRLNAIFSEAAPIAGQTMVTAMVGALRITGMAEGYFTARPGDAIEMSLLGGPDAVFTTEGQRISG